MRKVKSSRPIDLAGIKSFFKQQGDKRNFKKRKGAIFTPCKICRSITVVRTGSGWGTVRQVFDDKGTIIDTDISKLNHRMSSVLRCTYCGAIRKDVVFSDQKLIRK
jgi:hypothetical protein